MQKKYLDKLQSKTKGAVTKHTILKNVSEFDGDNDGFITFSEFQKALERAGNSLTSQEAMFLYSFWDTMGGQKEPEGLVNVQLAASDLIEAAETYDGAVFNSGPEKCSGGGNKSNNPSQEGGIFGGGAFAADAGGRAYQRPVGGQMPMSNAAPAMPAAPVEKPRGNQSSIAGGIFGEDDGAPPTRGGGGNKSNRSSIEGGIFGDAPAMAPVQRNKPYSNQSSIPGGIFG